MALGAAIIVAVAAVFMLPSEKIAKIAVDQLEAMTGREVSVEGGVEISFYPVLGVKTGPMSISNAPWSNGGAMLRAEAVNIGVETAAILRGVVRVSTMELVRPEILLERHKDGRGNWQLDTGGAPGGDADGSADGLGLSIETAKITDGSLVFLDHANGSKSTISDVDIALKIPNLAGRADIRAILRPAGKPVTIVAGIDGFTAFLAGTMVPVTVRVDAAGGDAEFGGLASAHVNAKGKISADINDSTAFLSALGMGGVDVPRGFGRAISINALAVVTKGELINLREMVAQLDQNRIAGAVDITLGAARPFVTARIKAGAIDLSGMAGADGASASSGWSKSAIDASGLSAINGKMRITATSIDLGDLKFGATDVGITIDRARAVVKLSKLAGYGGVFGGQVVANNRAGLSVGGTVTARGVEMQDLLGDMAGITRFSGKANGEVNFLGSGQSVDTIMRSLKGKGQFSVGQGTISGIDLDRLMSKGDGSGGTTVFDTLAASFTMSKGVVSNSDLKMELPRIVATGKGAIGLGARDINYLVTPVALAARGGKGLAIPVRIRGPWSGPKIVPDLKAAIDLNLAEEKKAIEEKVEARVKEEIQGRLGLTVEDGQSIEDAIGKKVEDELTKGLLKLLK